MNESFDAFIDRLVDAEFFMEQAVEFLEKGMIERVLRRTEGNQSEASKILGIHRNTLLRKMVEYDIDGKRPRPKPVSRVHAKKKTSRSRAS
ncbi:MAG TPA: helix-turn-helix domain-containing protein [Bryobacteraceae bacterium]|jgi:DNA-binding NtrC family response regulator|nr:helix-turn-helix domain-containing protein [Bryobacteraceae bacterium]